MLGREDVKTAETALKLLIDNLPLKTLKEKNLKIEDSLNAISSKDIFSSEDLPAFKRSTVDGYAVKAEDTFGATETMPVYLNLEKEIFMGQMADFSLSEDGAAKIPTGGMLPDVADASVMFEHVQIIDDKMIEVFKPVAPAENVIQKGEDVKKGEIIIRRGRRIRPQDIGACAGVGVTEITVYEKPKVSVISTGDEIVSPEKSLSIGEVRDINSYMLTGMIEESGGIPLIKGIFKDDYEIIRDVMETSLKDSDLIIISGGTSVGTKDIIAKIIDDFGSPGVLFHGLSLKPGKPMIGGMINGVPVFGLPGHPAAVSICFEIFILPILNILSGLNEKFPQYSRRIVKAKLSKNISSTQGREEHIRVILEEKEDGLWAEPVLGKSGLITTLVKADGTIVVPLNVYGIEKGTIVDVRLF
ncbi:MAG: molybdopterin molybdenumtransferase MoeA [Nitrospirae bacterium GWC2_42_7]|nr:MAG: molybdopterin molybdenumtransferase MoeA [Nitrospirae bacterium GWC2_42_7]